LIQEMVQFSRQPQVAQSMVFLPDYDIELAQEMVQGIDVWINTPRRPWEACGTSGMKVLVNGGLNLSELDGWWAEAYRPGLGWSLGDGKEHDPDWDRTEADQLYRLLENEVIPEYYDRNARGIPVKWVNRIRRSMCELATQFNSNRMLSQYVEEMYRPAVRRLGLRTASDGRLSQELAAWQKSIEASWDKLSFGDSRIINQGEQWEVECQVFMDKLSPDSIAVEIIADPVPGHAMTRQGLTLRKRLPGEEPFCTFRGQVRADRPAEDFSLRIIPSHPSAIIPLESRFILWKHPI
jgi:starch phosphorylase